MNVKRSNQRKGGFTKKDHIKYWVDTANRDWRAVKKMLESKTYVHALFFMHLVLEKLLKAHWVKDNIGNHPPRIHDLVKLYTQIKLRIPEIEEKFLSEMNDFQLEGRYPEQTRLLYQIYKQKKTLHIFTKVNLVRKCVLKNLQ